LCKLLVWLVLISLAWLAFALLLLIFWSLAFSRLIPELQAGTEYLY
jgi:hypothetical protein